MSEYKKETGHNREPVGEKENYEHLPRPDLSRRGELGKQRKLV